MPTLLWEEALGSWRPNRREIVPLAPESKLILSADYAVCCFNIGSPSYCAITRSAGRKWFLSAKSECSNQTLQLCLSRQFARETLHAPAQSRGVLRGN